MSKLTELLEIHCPNGVKYKTIKETVGLNRGRRLTKNELSDDGLYEVYHGSKDTPLGLYDKYNAPKNTTIVVNTGGIGGVKFIENEFWCSDGSFWLGQSEDIHPKYLYYCLSGYEKYFASKKRVGGVPTIDRSVVEDFSFPVPPLAVQEEIVKILDRFAEYAAELQAELQARQEQYEYYRDKLLTFNKIGGGTQSVTWMKMSEIGTFIRGNGLQKKDFTESGIPCIHYGQIYTHYGTFATKTKSYVSSETAKKCKKAHCGDLVFATVSENIDDVCKCVAWLGNEEICISGDSLAFSHNQNPKYMAYYFQTYAFARYKRSRVTGTKVIRLHQSQLEQFEIPIPSLAEQARIVNILDKFERLVSDLVQGLPAEIVAVQEQYEYYRDKLLSFPKYKLSA